MINKLLKTTAQAHPECIAIMDEIGTVNYHALYAEVKSLATHLHNAGITQGIGLGIMGRNGREFIVAMLAGMHCGAVVIPISHQLKAAEIASILKDTQLQAVLDDQSGLAPLKKEAVLIPCFTKHLRLAWTDVPTTQAITPLNDAAFIRYTSGTTGTSKGVVLTHTSILARVETAHACLQLDTTDKVLWVLPMAFHFLVTILVYIRAGAGIIICKDLLAKTLINQANLHSATLLYAAPMHYRLLAADSSGEYMHTLKYAISTSSAIPVAIVDKFTQRFNVPLVQAYGIIEAGLPLLDNKENPQAKSVGYPCAGLAVALLDEQNQVLTGVTTGRLAIRGSGLFDAYLSPWQLRKDCLAHGWFLTGDLANRQADGRIRICGREKTMINISGNKAFPEEIETILNQHADIINSHVFGQSHPLMGEIVCANVMVKENITLDVEAVLDFCRTQLSTYKVPQRLHVVAQINHTQSGKIKRV